jgi:LacI family transcriptional regulator
MDRRPTIIDVARAAGVSKSTVSLVLQNSPQVRDETRAQVRKAMNQIGYVYNRSAANLRTANAGLVGLVINDLRNPFFTEFATSLQMALSERNYATVIANTDEDPNLQSQVVSAMLEHGVSALVISPAYGDERVTFDAIERAGIPAMQVLRKVDSRVDQFPFAAPDYLTGGRLATEHLLESGALKIAFVGGLAGRSVTEKRMAGYLMALSMAGKNSFVVTGRASREFGREAAERIRSQGPKVDAAICFNDLVALGMLAGLARMGVNVGTDFKIVGFDDIEDCAQVYPSLSSIRCDIAGFGRHIAATVVDWLEVGLMPVPNIITPVELIVRESSRPPE